MEDINKERKEALERSTANYQKKVERKAKGILARKKS